MVTCSPRNATLVWSQHTASRTNCTMQMKAQTLLLNRRGEGGGMRERGGLSGRRGFCQLMVVLSTYAYTVKVYNVSVIYVHLACTCLSVRDDWGVWKERIVIFQNILFVFWWDCNSGVSPSNTFVHDWVRHAPDLMTMSSQVWLNITKKLLTFSINMCYEWSNHK